MAFIEESNVLMAGLFDTGSEEVCGCERRGHSNPKISARLASEESVPQEIQTTRHSGCAAVRMELPHH